MKSVAIGVDIGGGSVKLGLVETQGRIVARRSFLTRGPKNKKVFLNVLLENIASLQVEARKRGTKVSGVGIGAPGPIDVERGFVYFFPNIPGWENTRLKTVLQRRLGIPVFVDNDANVMALAEHRYGAGRGTKNMIALTLGTGVGGGMVLGGKLFHGSRYSAVEVGHLIINEAGPRCGCGSRGCVETYVGTEYFIRLTKEKLRHASGGLLKRWITQSGEKNLNPLLVEKAAKAGDALAKKVYWEVGEHLGTALAGLVNVLNPEKIVIGGAIAKSGPLLFKPIVATLKKKAFSIAARSVRVVPAALSVDAGIVGAAALCFSD